VPKTAGRRDLGNATPPLKGDTAQNAADYLLKGQMIFIEGRLQTRSWGEADGRKLYRTEIIAERIQFGPIPQQRDRDERAMTVAAQSPPLSEDQNDDVPLSGRCEHLRMGAPLGTQRSNSHPPLEPGPDASQEQGASIPTGDPEGHRFFLCPGALPPVPEPHNLRPGILISSLDELPCVPWTAGL
jgi:single-stranded DNA-binding protein